MFSNRLLGDILDTRSERERSLDPPYEDPNYEKLAAKMREGMQSAREAKAEQYQTINHVYQKWWNGEEITENDKKTYYKSKEEIFDYYTFFETKGMNESQRSFRKSIIAGIVAIGNEYKYFNQESYREMKKVFDKWWQGKRITRNDKRNYYYNKSLIIGFEERIRKKTETAKRFLYQL